jgi:hypothetical protein
VALSDVVRGSRGAAGLTGGAAGFFSFDGVFMVGNGNSISCASTAGGSGSRSLGFPMKYADTHSTAIQMDRAAGNVQ